MIALPYWGDAECFRNARLLEALPRNAGMAFSPRIFSDPSWCLLEGSASCSGQLTCDPAPVGGRMCSPHGGDRLVNTTLGIRYCAVISRPEEFNHIVLV